MTTDTIEHTTGTQGNFNKGKKAYRANYKTDDDINLDDPTVRQQVDPNTKVTNLPANPDEPINDPAEVLPPEETTYKKRYGDLRTFQQRREKELNERVTALEGQLKEATKQEIKFPKTEAEVDEWATKFPDVAAIVETIAMKKAQGMLASANERLESVEKMRVEVERDKAMNKIRGKHPEFDDLNQDQEFHDWAAVQPAWIRSALYEDNDPDGVIRAIDLYKFDNPAKFKKPENRQNDRQAASTVRTNTGRVQPSNTPGGGPGKILESEIQRMSPREFKEREDEIDKARVEGNIVYDVSAGAR